MSSRAKKRRHGNAFIKRHFDRWYDKDGHRRTGYQTTRQHLEQLDVLAGTTFADVVRVVMNNLHAHSISPLYEAFEPEVARRLNSSP